MINRVYGLLGISSKAGKLISGTDIILEQMAKNRVNLVIIAEDASDKTIKNMKYHCKKSNVEVIIYGNISENSKSIGKHNRAVIGIIDKNLADNIKKVIHGGEPLGKN